MSQFIGSWKLVSCDNFDAYLKELGINVILRKLAMLANPTVIITEKDGTWTMKTETIAKSSTCHFKLNEPFSETTIDDRVVEAEIFIEDLEKIQKLVHKQTDKQGRLSRIERTITDDRMDVFMTVNDVVSTAVFKRVKK